MTAPPNVRELRHRTDATTMLAAADELRLEDNCPTGHDLAALLQAVGEALKTVGRPPLAEAEFWRWSAVVHHARRISAKQVAK